MTTQEKHSYQFHKNLHRDLYSVFCGQAATDVHREKEFSVAKVCEIRPIFFSSDLKEFQKFLLWLYH